MIRRLLIEKQADRLTITIQRVKPITVLVGFARFCLEISNQPSAIARSWVTIHVFFRCINAQRGFALEMFSVLRHETLDMRGMFNEVQDQLRPRAAPQFAHGFIQRTGNRLGQFSTNGAGHAPSLPPGRSRFLRADQLHSGQLFQLVAQTALFCP